MARKRILETPRLKSWDEVNDALRQMAEAQLEINEINNDLSKQITGMKKIAEDRCKPYQNVLKLLEHDVHAFAEEHRLELGDLRSKKLTFGEVGFRRSVSVILPRAKEELQEVIRRLKVRQMLDCIITKEDISKEVLRKYGEDTVNAVGAQWKTKDTFGYDLDLAKLEQIKAGK